MTGRILWYFLAFLLPCGGLRAQADSAAQEPKKVVFRSLANEAFRVGEVLKYRVHYGMIDAGEAVLEVKELKKIGSRDCYRILGTGRSLGAFDWFFKVRDHYETYLDTEALFPWVFIRRVNEGGYKISQNYIFNHFRKKVKTGEKEFDVPENVQDILSAFYYARSIDFSNAKEGDVFEIMTFLDDEIWPFRIEYRGTEEIKSKLGTFVCLKFNPVLQTGRVFKTEEGLTIWITADKNHLPVRLQAEVLVGSIKMDLKSYDGVINPVAVKKRK